MVSIGDREWHITTHGYGMTAFNDDGLAYLKENVEPLLKDEKLLRRFRYLRRSVSGSVGNGC